MSEIYPLLRHDKEKEYCFIDTETCNLCLHECHNLPWQISILSVKAGKIIDTYDFLIKWPKGINVSKEAAIITHYNPKLVEEKGVSPQTALEILDYKLNASDIIAGHNILGFDAYMIQAFYRENGKKPFNIIPKALDTFPIAKAIKLNIGYSRNEDFAAWQYRLYHYRAKGLKCSLGALGKEYEIEHQYENLHDSLSDLKLNTKLWDKLKFQIEI